MSADPAFGPDRNDPITTESQAADLVRCTVDLDDIVRGSLLLVLCDPAHRPVVPVLITDVPVTAPAGDVLDHWFEHLGRAFEVDMPALIFARARPGQSFVLDHDRQWHEAVGRGCAGAGIPLLGSFVLTPHAVVPYPALGSCEGLDQR